MDDLIFLQSYIFFNTQNFTEQNAKRAKPGLVKYMYTNLSSTCIYQHCTNVKMLEIIYNLLKFGAFNMKGIKLAISTCTYYQV